MSQVLGVTLSIFECDRAWLVYPCDPESATWRAPMERTRPEYPGAMAAGIDFPMDPDVRRAMTAVRASLRPADLRSCLRVRTAPRSVGRIQHSLDAVHGHLSQDGQGVHVRPASVLPCAHLDRGREDAVRGDRQAPCRRSDQPHRLSRPARPRRTVAHPGADHSRSRLDEGRQRRLPALQSAVRAPRRRCEREIVGKTDHDLVRQGSCGILPRERSPER